jgi:hypothetical protein
LCACQGLGGAVRRMVSAAGRVGLPPIHLTNGRPIVALATIYQAKGRIIDSVAGDMGSNLRQF